MASTQSPLLRQKVGELVQQQGPNPQIEDVAGELHKRILVLLLRTTYVQRTKCRGIMASRQHRTQSSEPIQNDQSGDLNESSYTSMAHDREAPALDPLQEFENSDDGIFDGLDESPGYSEHDKEQEVVPLGWLSCSSEHLHGDIDETYIRRPNDTKPESMGADDIMEDTLLYTTGEYDPEYDANLTSDETGHVALSQEVNPYSLRVHAGEMRRSYCDPDDMDEEEELSRHDEYQPSGEEEGYLKHHLAFDDTGIVDLSTDTFMHASRVQNGSDNEMSHTEEGPPALIRAYRDDTYGHCDADGASEHETPYDEGSYHHPYQFNDQGHGQGGFYEGPDEGDIYYAHQHYAQDELYDQAMPRLSDTDVESSGMHYSQCNGHPIDDHPADTVCTPEVPEYTCQCAYAEEIETDGRPSYAFLERHPHGSDDVPRTYSLPPARGACWARSLSDEQKLIGTQPPSRGHSEYGFTHGHLVETLDRGYDVGVFSSATGNVDMY